MIKKILLFLIPLVIAAIVVLIYFKVNQKISNITIPNIPSVSFNDFIKFSRFSLDKAPSESLVGEITSLTGEVKYETRNATEAAIIKNPVKVQQGESLYTGSDGNVNLLFVKALEIAIFPNTSLSVIQTLPVNLVFVQKSGLVRYKKLANNTISIRALHLLIENKGEIEVSVDREKMLVNIKVLSGTADLAYNNVNNDTRTVTLEAGKSLIFNDGTRRVVLE